MTRVGWDLDGVHYYFAESVWATLIQQGRVTGSMPAVTHWHFYRDAEWGVMTDEEFVNTCHAGADKGIIFSIGEGCPDAMEVMNTLAYSGHTTVIVTDRSFGSTPSVSEEATKLWLTERGAVYDEIHFTADKASVALDYMIDDKVENFLALQAAGVKCYLLDRPWNQHVVAGKYRIYSVKEYGKIVVTETFLAESTH